MLKEEKLLEQAKRVRVIAEVVSACSENMTWVTTRRGEKKSSLGFDIFYDPQKGFTTVKSEQSKTVRVGYEKENVTPPKVIVKILDCPEQAYNDLCSAITLFWSDKGVNTIDFQKMQSHG